MFGLGFGEIMVILVVALIVLGPDKLPEAARTIGRTIRELRKQTDSLKDTIEQDEALGGTVREIKSALRGDPYYPQRSIIKPPLVPPVAQAPTPLAPPAETAAVAPATDTPEVSPPAPPKDPASNG